MIKRITDKNKLLSIIIRSNFRKDGLEFVTPDNFSQQLGYMFRPRGYVIAPHIHNEIAREVKLTMEVLFIKRGKVRIDYYNEERNYLESAVLNQGDIVLLAAGGHSFEVLEDCEIIEVKQGPYLGERDKGYFEPIEKSKILLRIKDDTGK